MKVGLVKIARVQIHLVLNRPAQADLAKIARAAMVPAARITDPPASARNAARSKLAVPKQNGSATTTNHVMKVLVQRGAAQKVLVRTSRASLARVMTRLVVTPRAIKAAHATKVHAPTSRALSHRHTTARVVISPASMARVLNALIVPRGHTRKRVVRVQSGSAMAKSHVTTAHVLTSPVPTSRVPTSPVPMGHALTGHARISRVMRVPVRTARVRIRPARTEHAHPHRIAPVESRQVPVRLLGNATGAVRSRRSF